MARQNITAGSPFEPVYGYSRAVRVGNQVHVSGTTAQPPHFDCDTYGQTLGAFAIIRTALEQAGARMEDVVRTVVYVIDIADAALVARAHRGTFGHIMPASTLVQVAALLQPNMRVEVEAAVIDEEEEK
jgi:enamine deaminase RidA (YjgF/YER057c/UK114 family)